MSQNINQIFMANPAVSLNNTDLFYLGRSPYGTGNDMATQFSVIKTYFLQPSLNLSDLGNTTTARANLGLGTAATKTASSNIPSIVAAVVAPIVSNNIAIFSDNVGTLVDHSIPYTNLATLSGSAFTGVVTLAADPTTALGAATKQYVDAQVSAVFTWTDITGATQTLVPNNGYTANNATTVGFTLPTTCPYGAIIKVAGVNNTGSWSISQGSGQRIRYGDIVTTTGTGGALASTLPSDYVELICIVANTTFKVLSSQGQLQTA